MELELKQLKRNGNEESYITRNRRTAIRMVCERTTAGLLDRLQNGTHRGKGGEADQSTHGRIGLGTACKEETSRMRNVSSERSGAKKNVFGLRKTVY
jgi:hypothetical protein